MPLDMHRCNWAERAIRTFKDHFLAILAGVDSSFPLYLWDLLLPQAGLTLNLLRQLALNPWISVWEFFHGPFDFNKTPLGPVGCRILIHAKPPVTRRSWDFRAKEGFYIGLVLDSYWCFKLVKSDTKSQVISDTVEFRHAYPAITTPTLAYKIIHGLQVMSSALKDAPPSTTITQVEAIANLCDLFKSWRLLGPQPTNQAHIPSPGHPRVPNRELPRVDTPLLPSNMASPTPARSLLPGSALTIRIVCPVTPAFNVTPCWITSTDIPSPRMVSPPPRMAIKPSPSSALPPREPIAHRTRSRAVAPPLTLFAGGCLYHKGVTYRIPMAKATSSPPVHLGFAGLCGAFSMSPKEVNGFANLCSSLEKIDHFDPSAFLVLDPVTGELLEHRQLRCDPR
jgi:hypothetical protein